VFDIYEEDLVVEHAKVMGDYLTEELEKIAFEFNSVVKRKGMGLMQGLELRVPVGDIVNEALENGLVVISAGGNVLRMLPPLIIGQKNVDFALDILRKIL
jgi:acetylornithine/N-succinyldiaminopimelate aminotransferase